ncbi:MULTISPECIES: hypothetical protein [Bifidobacterium]|uniref:Uncharacterized protein n=1 Tax=Bifidobacterium reuteri DSM 23975 TaxID=1437610 RepID=A0A087CSI3_9BIFI|nr:MULTISPECIES: hypothetical protein [Bifidobacterium]KFI86233.1 hypothetical protein BREU_1406 [Bifidobacterium reuteri DSM 23975]TPF91455.1 hypothetical protein BW10_00425 [Bifidobacterium sp. UTBIF-56]TPF91960.1 hypothetical protein BW14_10615 [Bifidobacterium sp. UTBIF-68]
MSIKSEIELGIPDGTDYLGCMRVNARGRDYGVWVQTDKATAVVSISWDDMEQLWRWLGMTLGHRVPEVI